MHPWLNVALNGTVIQAKIQGKVSLPQGRKSKSSEWEQRNERKDEKKRKTAITRRWYYDIMLLGTINRKLALNTSLWFDKSVYNPKMEYLQLRHYDIFWREQVMWNLSKIRVQKKPELWCENAWLLLQREDIVHHSYTLECQIHMKSRQLTGS